MTFVFHKRHENTPSLLVPVITLVSQNSRASQLTAEVNIYYLNSHMLLFCVHTRVEILEIHEYELTFLHTLAIKGMNTISHIFLEWQSHLTLHSGRLFLLDDPMFELLILIHNLVAMWLLVFIKGVTCGIISRVLIFLSSFVS